MLVTHLAIILGGGGGGGGGEVAVLSGEFKCNSNPVKHNYYFTLTIKQFSCIAHPLQWDH